VKIFRVFKQEGQVSDVLNNIEETTIGYYKDYVDALSTLEQIVLENLDTFEVADYSDKISYFCIKDGEEFSYNLEIIRVK